ISTPNGMNMFYKLWHDAERGKNEYVTTEVHWSEVPGRDAKWKEQTIANTSQRQFTQEFECEFLGSVDTLISASKLRTLVYEDPIKQNKGLAMYEEPKEENSYIITVDVSRGTENDYSAFIVFDITTVPWRIVAKYRNNEIKPMLFPSIIEETAKAYNKAYVLVEINDIGEQVSNILHFDLEYDNILMCSMRGRAGQIVGSGFSGKKSQLGLKMSKTVKKIGCSNLKTLIEDDKLVVSDYDIISELTTFIQKNQSFEAEDG
ncbi:MAG: terminase, partial [Nitrosopumilaceae archaeon]|nr:terminase [Nitrosopumilaceae archaeon]